jgi:hypothetical protein
VSRFKYKETTNSILISPDPKGQYREASIDFYYKNNLSIVNLRWPTLQEKFNIEPYRKNIFN